MNENGEGTGGLAQAGRPEAQPDAPIDFYFLSSIEMYECTI